MLCQSCFFKKSCDHLCRATESYLRSKRNYKTTYVNKEIGISEVSLKKGSYGEWVLSKKNRDCKDSHETWMRVVGIIESGLTKKQHSIIWMFLDGVSMAAIGRKLDISGQAVKYAIFGHPKHGGGIVKRIQKELAVN